MTAAARAWATLCHHCDGIAMGVLYETLADCGALEHMATGDFSARDLEAGFGIRSGYAALICKLFLSQGLAMREGDRHRLTDDGRLLSGHPCWFGGARKRVDLARSILTEDLAGSGPSWDCAKPMDDMPDRFRQQRAGPVCAALWHRLSRGGWDINGPLLQNAPARGLLHQAGWLDGEGWTKEGEIAKAIAPQFDYPLSYLSTYNDIPDFLFYGGSLKTRQQGEPNPGVDRELDIEFSGKVFSKACRAEVLKVVLPVFDQPLDKQPSALVDTGSGDGTVLVELFDAIRSRTKRGEVLDTHPLTLVGVEYEEVARLRTEKRLETSDAPSLAIFGDIGVPVEIAKRLAAEGIDMVDALHINKSVVHNRLFVPPAHVRKSPQTSAVFCAPDGSSISADAAFSSLVDLFLAWGSYIERHGMVCVEAHTVDPEKTARHLGQSLTTGLDAAHGYSGQLLTEIELHRKALQAAGLVSLTTADLGTDMMGEPIMSVDFLVPKSREAAFLSARGDPHHLFQQIFPDW